jgi:hypothetical protein
MTPQAFNKALDAAKPGEIICYHAGAYLDPKAAGTAALRAYFEGRVELVQKKLMGDQYSYLAIVRRDETRPRVPLALENLARRLLRISEEETVA